MSAGARQHTWRWLVAGTLAVAAVIAVDAWRSSSVPAESAPALDPATLSPGFGPATFDAALASGDAAVDGARAALAAHPDEWLRMEALGRALAARHRLAADAADLAEADRLLDGALALAPWPAGPALTAAEVSLTLHDLDGAERALARFDASATPAPSDEQAAARSLRCEVEFQRGNLPRARQLCSGGDLATALRRANLLAQSGDTDAAVRIVEGELRRPRLAPQALATLALQRAALALATGDWDASGRWACAAERVFPGYWLSEAYVAQQYALEGDRAEAIRRYTKLAERTGHPDVLDALARVGRTEGRTSEAALWAARAGDAWEARARQLPMTYATHHAEHLLLHGSPRRAVAFAQADHGRRPFPGTIVHYAYALWRSGEPARALEVVREGEAQGFLTAEMKLVEALALGSLGRAAEAGAALAAARRLNPRIDSERQQLVAFGRD